MIRSEGVEWKTLPLREAYEFGIQHGLQGEVSTIRDMEMYLFNLYEARAMLEAAGYYWK